MHVRPGLARCNPGVAAVAECSRDDWCMACICYRQLGVQERKGRVYDLQCHVCGMSPGLGTLERSVERRRTRSVVPASSRL